MKFKRDYKIQINADNNDISFWSATHKWIHKALLSKEDYKTILSMLDEVRGYITETIKHM